MNGRTWRCPNERCECELLHVNQDWLAEHGLPVCPKCDADMELVPEDEHVSGGEERTWKCAECGAVESALLGRWVSAGTGFELPCEECGGKMKLEPLQVPEVAAAVEEQLQTAKAKTDAAMRKARRESGPGEEHPALAPLAGLIAGAMAEADQGHKYECGNCDWTGDVLGTDLRGLAALGTRLDPGSVVPAGECRRCGALVYLRRPKPEGRWEPEPQPIRTELELLEALWELQGRIPTLHPIADKLLMLRAAQRGPDCTGTWAQGTKDQYTRMVRDALGGNLRSAEVYQQALADIEKEDSARPPTDGKFWTWHYVNHLRDALEQLLAAAEQRKAREGGAR